MHTRRVQRASLFAYYAGYTIHFQSIDWENLREGNVRWGLAFSRAGCIATEGATLYKSTRNQLLYIRTASVGQGGQSDICPVWETIFSRTAAAREGPQFATHLQNTVLMTTDVNVKQQDCRDLVQTGQRSYRRDVANTCSSQRGFFIVCIAPR